MNEADAHSAPPAAVLDQYGLQQPHFERITSGHINLTWLVRQHARTDIPEKLILQRVNQVFDLTVQNDIATVTAHLRSCGVKTIKMIETSSSDVFLEHEGHVWRLLAYIEGTTTEHVASSMQASEAGRVLGEFHSAMQSFRGTLSLARANAHDFSLHLQRLDMALLKHSDHRHHREIATLAAGIVETTAEINDYPPTSAAFVHGDPKISNIIFDGVTAACLIDLDTITTGPIETEIADAMRSWCNTEAEDSLRSQFSADLFEAACTGYGQLTPEVAAMLPDTTAKIAVELATRFCADALNESYFGWDSQRFESASIHNQVRCQAQLALAADILGQRADLRRIAVAASA